MSELQANLAGVLERLEQACVRSGRSTDDVTLIAVSKTWPASAVLELAACGQVVFGENKVQEAQQKIPLVEEAGARVAWQLIGPLQRNKARHAVGLFELLHGVDSRRLLIEIDRRAAAAGLVQDLLIQVNLAGEQTKAGVTPPALEALLVAASGLANVRARGLMAIPPRAERPGDNRRWFDALRELRDSVAARLDTPLPELSMGMSGDFEEAIEAGATLVRVGTAIFGPRLPPGTTPAQSEAESG